MNVGTPYQIDQPVEEQYRHDNEDRGTASREIFCRDSVPDIFHLYRRFAFFSLLSCDTCIKLQETSYDGAIHCEVDINSFDSFVVYFLLF